ncbi:glycosyltransferase family 2 protein [Natrialbaceae archaeon A-CW1-1]
MQRFALGIIATDRNSDRLFRTILRAVQKGLFVFVLPYGINEETIELVRQLVKQHEVSLVDGTGCTTREEARQKLIAHSQANAMDGIAIWGTGDTVDIDSCRQRFSTSEQYAISAASPSSRSGGRCLVGIPAYNEAPSIQYVVGEAAEYADEVLVIDDGSDDETAERARKAGASVVVHQKNKGYGAALKTAFVEAERSLVDHLVILDGDGQHDPGDIPTLVECQQNSGSEIVIGSRFGEESDTSLPRYRRLGLVIVNLLTNLSLGVVSSEFRVSDTQSGFRVYNRDAIVSLAADGTIGDNMGASTDILHHAHKHDYSIDEVGTTVRYDVENGSSQNPLTHGFHLVMNLVRTIEEEHPISSLGIPGIGSTLLGIGFAYLSIVNYVDTNTFPLGMALVSVFFVLAGIFSCFTAIILHSLNRHSYTRRVN